jgi:hypothetical protein
MVEAKIHTWNCWICTISTLRVSKGEEAAPVLFNADSPAPPSFNTSRTMILFGRLSTTIGDTSQHGNHGIGGRRPSGCASLRSELPLRSSVANIIGDTQAFENTSTSVAAAQMRNRLTQLAETVKDPEQKKASRTK